MKRLLLPLAFILVGSAHGADLSQAQPIEPPVSDSQLRAICRVAGTAGSIAKEMKAQKKTLIDYLEYQRPTDGDWALYGILRFTGELVFDDADTVTSPMREGEIINEICLERPEGFVHQYWAYKDRTQEREQLRRDDH